MFIRQLSYIAICLTALFTSPALYAHHNTEYGRVIRATPIYEIQHHRKRHHHNSHYNNRHGRAIAGGIIGAAIGRHVGRNKHAGAIIGGLIGARAAHKHAQDRCHQTHSRNHHYQNSRHTRSREVLTGYNVTYRYHGHTYTTFTERRPGKRIRIMAANNHARGHAYHRS